VIAYVFTKLVAGRARELHWLMWGIAGASVIYFLLPIVRGWVGA
jgi:xanthine/uracil/vitamin C permease (AzgA family)